MSINLQSSQAVVMDSILVTSLLSVLVKKALYLSGRERLVVEADLIHNAVEIVAIIGGSYQERTVSSRYRTICLLAYLQLSIQIEGSHFVVLVISHGHVMPVLVIGNAGEEFVEQVREPCPEAASYTCLGFGEHLDGRLLVLSTIIVRDQSLYSGVQWSVTLVPQAYGHPVDLLVVEGRYFEIAAIKTQPESIDSSLSWVQAASRRTDPQTCCSPVWMILVIKGQADEFLDSVIVQSMHAGTDVSVKDSSWSTRHFNVTSVHVNIIPVVTWYDTVPPRGNARCHHTCVTVAGDELLVDSVGAFVAVFVPF